MNKPIRVEKAAEDELRAAIAWYEGQQVGLGADLLLEAQRTMDQIERREERPRCRHPPRMSRVTLSVEEEEAYDPLYVRFLGADGVVPYPQRAAHLFE